MRTDPIEFVCLILLVACVALAGCAELRAELRAGWVKVDFMEGHPSEYIVCHLVSKDGEMTARCVSMETVEREMERRKKSHEGDL